MKPFGVDVSHGKNVQKNLNFFMATISFVLTIKGLLGLSQRAASQDPKICLFGERLGCGCTSTQSQHCSLLAWPSAHGCEQYSLVSRQLSEAPPCSHRAPKRKLEG